MTLFSLFKWVLAAGTLAGGCLALLGCHLAARDKSMQTLCIGQGATLGVLMGMGITHLYFSEPETPYLPFLVSSLMAASTYLLSERIAKGKLSSRNTFYCSVFSALLAMGYLLTATVPGLESHMTQVFFGDLATLSNRDAFFTMALSTIGLLLLLVYRRSVTSHSFNQAIFGQTVLVVEGPLSPRAFNLLTLITLAFSVQFLGFLFTASCLFLPTAIATFLPHRGLVAHFTYSVALAVMSTIGGFSLSLHWSRLPTVPMIVLVMLVLGIISQITHSWYNFRNVSR